MLRIRNHRAGSRRRFLTFGWIALLWPPATSEAGTLDAARDSHTAFLAGGAQVTFPLGGVGPERHPFVVTLDGREVGRTGFELAYEGRELSALLQDVRQTPTENGLNAELRLKGGAQIVSATTVQRGARGVGVTVNIHSSPGLMTHILPLGYDQPVKRLYFGMGVVAEGIRQPALITKGGYCSSLAVEFDHGLFEFQHISQPPRYLHIDPERNLYSFELQRTLDEQGDVFTSHGEWDRVSDDVTYTFYVTDDYLDGVRYLRDKLDLPRSEVTRRLIGRQHMNLSFFASDGGRRGHDRDHIRSQSFEAVRFCQSLFIRGATDLAIQGDRQCDNRDLFRLADRYGAMKSIYQQYGQLNPIAAERFDQGWSRVESPALGPEQVYHCARPELHAGRYHPVRIFGVATQGDYRDFPVIAPHVLADLVRQHRPAVQRAFNIDMIYQDVISGQTGGGYWDQAGRYVKAQAAVAGMRAFLEACRAYGPVHTEFAEEAYIGWFDAAYPSYVFGAPALGIQAERWEFFPAKDLLYHDLAVFPGVGMLANYKTGWTRDAGAFELTDQERGYGERVRDARSTAILMGHPADLKALSSHSGMKSWPGPETDLTCFLKDYYLHHAFHRRAGLRPATSFEFVDGDLRRQAVGWEGGTRVWVNRGPEVWEVDGHRLPQYGFLIRGGDLLEYSALAPGDGQRWIDYVDTPDELYADPCGGSHDFGKVETDTQVAVLRLTDQVIKIVPYSVNRRGNIRLRLDRIAPGWDYERTILAAFDGVGRRLGEARWTADGGLRFSPDAVPGAVFYLAYPRDVDPRVRWDIDTDLAPLEAWQPVDGNLVESPGFEEAWYGLHGWMSNPDPSGVTTAIDPTEHHTGTSSFKLVFSGERSSGYKQRYQWLALEAGERYRLRYYVKAEGLSQGVGLAVAGPAGVLHPVYRLGGELARERDYYVKGTTSWRLIETTFTASAARMLLFVHTPPADRATGTAWIDDVGVQRLDASLAAGRD